MLKMYLKNLLRVLHKKWVKGECRNLCCFCKHYEECQYEMGMNYEYIKGFDDGYNAGKEDATFESERRVKHDI